MRNCERVCMEMHLQDHRKALQLYLATVLFNAVQRWHAAGHAQLKMTLTMFYLHDIDFYCLHVKLFEGLKVINSLVQYGM